MGVCASAQPRGGEAEPPVCISEAEIQISASPSQVTLGQSSVVSWTVSLPNGCSSVRVRFNGEEVGRSGSRTVTPVQSVSTYSVTIRQTQGGVNAQRSALTKITVGYPDRVIIDPSTHNPVQVLIAALGTNPVVIELCVDLDLTGHSLEIGDNTTLTASPACARGPRNLGPRIFIRDKRAGGTLFVIRGDNVLISGFRLEGPTPDIGVGDNILERGIRISPFECVCSTRPECQVENCLDKPGCCEPLQIQNIKISNMEIYHWSGAGVEVMDNTARGERGRLFNTTVGAVHIGDSYFHHNRHGDGYGYGVAVTNGAYALIERNVFDENRHAIMGNSSDGKKDLSGYTARENLILAGGGRHCSESKLARVVTVLTPWNASCWQTHQIDMHGNKDFRVGGKLNILFIQFPLNILRYLKYHSCCGIAGETIIIERNTILYASGKAIKIRGNPYDKAVVDGNVFTHNSSDEAIEQNGDPKWYQWIHDNITNPIDIRPNNLYKVLPLSDVGRCDFVGDGVQDTFAATGVTWWAWSPKTQQWRYLNTMPEPFSELQVRDFDKDGVCDVAKRTSNPTAPPTRYSKSGTGAWQSLLAVEH